MSKGRRIEKLISGILMLLGAFIMAQDPDDGYIITIGILSIYILVYAIRKLIYYFSMARYMVGGNLVLYKAVAFLNLGIFVGSLTDVPRFYVMIYLSVVIGFSGLVDILHAMETKGKGGVHWKIKLMQGIAITVLAVCGLCFMSSVRIVVYLYCFSIATSAIGRISEALRKSAIVYIS